jgi:hypothetical protein
MGFAFAGDRAQQLAAEFADELRVQIVTTMWAGELKLFHAITFIASDAHLTSLY